MNKCTDCLLDLTDACTRGAGRATDDEICDSFFAKEVYEVNKNESWQLGYQQGRADAEIIRKVFSKMEQPNNCLFNSISACCYPIGDCMNCPITIDEMKY